MSGPAMEWAWRVSMDKRLPRPVRVVFQGLAFHANRYTGEVWTATETLMDECGLGRSTVSAALVALEALGVLEVRRRPGWSTIWTFPPDACLPPRPTHPATDRATHPAIDRATPAIDRATPRHGSRANKRSNTGGEHHAPAPEHARAPEAYVACPECGGVGFVVNDGRRLVCRNTDAHRGDVTPEPPDLRLVRAPDHKTTQRPAALRFRAEAWAPISVALPRADQDPGGPGRDLRGPTDPDPPGGPGLCGPG